MHDTFLLKIKEILLEQKRQLIAKSSLNEDPEIDTDGDEFDEIQGNSLIDMHNKLCDRDFYKISQIEEALEQIKNNTYGICKECGEPIAERRLMINPHIFICISCAEEQELERKRYNY
jgi:DnaK suppressor protein